MMRVWRVLAALGAVAIAAGILTFWPELESSEAAQTQTMSTTTRVKSTYRPASTTTTAVQFPDDPRGQFDALVYQNGWKVGTTTVYDRNDPAYHDKYRYPSYAVVRLCGTLSRADLYSPTQLLKTNMESERTPENVDYATAMQAGFPMLCDQDANTQMQRYLAGDIERWYGNGTYIVGTGEGQIPPGTYVSSKPNGMIRDGYWERTSVDGEIIDNNFITSAQQVTVTIAPTDGQFTSERMGSWKPA